MEVKLTPHLDARFTTLTWQLLDAEHFKSALFWSERYFFLDRENHNARHLYALSLLRCGQTQSALYQVNLQEEFRCPECTEILAKCCTALGRHTQAREALESIANGEASRIGGITTRQVHAFPEPSTLLCRAGASAKQANQPDSAIAKFKESLRLSPFIWEAFEGLCSLGSFPSVEDLFTLHQEETHPENIPPATTFDAPPVLAHMTSGLGFFTPDAVQAANQGRRLEQKSTNMHFPDSLLPSDTSFYNTEENSMLAHQLHPPRANGRNLSSADEMGPAPKKARNAAVVVSKPALPDKVKQSFARGIPQKARAACNLSGRFSSVADQATTKPAKAEAGTLATARRSTRLLSSGSTSGKEQSRLQKYTSRARKGLPKSRTRSQASEDDDMFSVDSAVSPSASPMLSPLSDGSPGPSTLPPQQDCKDTMEWNAADKAITNLLRQHATALQKMAQYECQAVLDEIETFSPDMQRTPWALSLVGRAYYEMVDYQKADGAFREVRKIDPYRLYDMELYSTLLWHLQKNVRLSFLAQELVSIDSQSSQAWIAIGNCFSLQKERTKAMSCFQRAAQLDPGCAYAFTLSGHEYVEEDIEKAIGFFQTALRVDPRHYNAWYGLGTCYLRLSKFRQAEYHYRRATELHPTNAVLLGCLGMAVERKGISEPALNLYKEAVRLSPDNALVRYRRAKILISLERYQEALDDLLHLRDIAPEESNVVYLLARLYRLMGNTVQSAIQLATARDLSPQSINKIKKLVETTKEDERAGGDMDEG